ncbi:hypothetical protein P4132_04865 [Pseudomonas aeruginosa]|nr:hypothetical protein [Pseudomonas aeruginosa]
MEAVTSWTSIRRIIQRSGAPTSALTLGLALRVLERCSEVLPYLLCWLWLGAVLPLSLQVCLDSHLGGQSAMAGSDP